MAIKIARVQTADRLINQLQQNIASVVEPLFSDLSGQFNVTLTGCTTVPIGTVYWQRSVVGGPVTMSIPAMTATSNAATAFLQGVPAALWPSITQYFTLLVYDNGTLTPMAGSLTPEGLFSLGYNFTFTTSGTKGTEAGNITYNTAT